MSKAESPNVSYVRVGRGMVKVAQYEKEEPKWSWLPRFMKRKKPPLRAAQSHNDLPGTSGEGMPDMWASISQLESELVARYGRGAVPQFDALRPRAQTLEVPEAPRVRTRTETLPSRSYDDAYLPVRTERSEKPVEKPVERPAEKPPVEKPLVEKPLVEKPPAEKPPAYVPRRQLPPRPPPPSAMLPHPTLTRSPSRDSGLPASYKRPIPARPRTAPMQCSPQLALPLVRVRITCPPHRSVLRALPALILLGPGSRASFAAATWAQMVAYCARNSGISLAQPGGGGFLRLVIEERMADLSSPGGGPADDEFGFGLGYYLSLEMALDDPDDTATLPDPPEGTVPVASFAMPLPTTLGEIALVFRERRDIRRALS